MELMKQYVCGVERGGLGGGGIIVPTRGMIPYDTVCGGSHSEIQKKQKPAGTRGWGGSNFTLTA